MRSSLKKILQFNRLAEQYYANREYYDALNRVGAELAAEGVLVTDLRFSNDARWIYKYIVLNVEPH